MKLSNEKERILNQRYTSIVAYVHSRFKSCVDVEDIAQEATIAYAEALNECDLTSNYHSYCMTRAKWGALKQLKRHENRNRLTGGDSLRSQSELTALSNSIFDQNNVDSHSINPVTMCSVLEKVYAAYQQLKPSHKDFIEKSYWDISKSNIKNTIIKERRGRDIKKAFLTRVLKGLDNDVGFCESGLYTAYNAQTQ
jgi:DNA-directed RNA polymerase specialized sigma24 family protein